MTEVYKAYCSRQIALLKSPKSISTSSTSSLSSSSSSVGFKSKLQALVETDHALVEYDIISTVFERENKAAFVVQTVDNEKYLLKVEMSRVNEVYDLLLKIDSPYIVKFIRQIVGQDYTYYIFEYLHGFTLSKLLPVITADLATEIILQVAYGLRTLHQHNIIHCDIKLENIMLTETAKIIDFDLSLVGEDCVSDVLFGTPAYIAPESREMLIYSRKSDVWSLGVVAKALFADKVNNNMSTIINMMLIEDDRKRIGVDELIELLEKNENNSIS